MQYVPGTPKPKATARWVSGYWVLYLLTSSKCLAELEEKESKKKKAEEKEKQKQEHAEKKQLREGLLKKAEEKARKVEEKKKHDEESPENEFHKHRNTVTIPQSRMHSSGRD